MDARSFHSAKTLGEYLTRQETIQNTHIFRTGGAWQCFLPREALRKLVTPSLSSNLALEQLQWVFQHGAYRRSHHDWHMAARKGLSLSMMVTFHLLLLLCFVADAAANGSSVRVSDDLGLRRALADPQVGTAATQPHCICNQDSHDAWVPVAAAHASLATT